MYIPQISIFSPAPIETLTAARLRTGIEQRLPLLTYLFCPEDELEPEAVLKQLRIEETENGELKLRWRPRMRFPPRAYRFADELQAQLESARFSLRFYPADITGKARDFLSAAVDGVGFHQGYTRNDMGWPVVMAAAATLVDQAGGVIVTNGHGWFVPSGNEVQWLFDPRVDRPT